MGKSLKISKRLYEELEQATRQRGLASVEELLEAWHSREVDLCRRREAVSHVSALREGLRGTYIEMPDSVPLIREDRER